MHDYTCTHAVDYSRIIFDVFEKTYIVLLVLSWLFCVCMHIFDDSYIIYIHEDIHTYMQTYMHKMGGKKSFFQGGLMWKRRSLQPQLC